MALVTKLNAKKYKFNIKDQNTGKIISVYDYFLHHFNLCLNHWDLPLVEETTKKGTVFPMKCCMIAAYQCYLYTSDDEQVRTMIKFVVSRPPQRMISIRNRLQILNWDKDPTLNRYGIQITNQMLATKARLRVTPKVQLENALVTPGVSGRCDLKGCKFLHPNPTPLISWGVCVLDNGQFRCNQMQVKNFIKRFIEVYQSHGGRVENKNPPYSGGHIDEGKAVEAV